MFWPFLAICGNMQGMISFNGIILFSITVFIASIIPGPSMLLALTHGMQYGTRKTIVSALGNVTVTVLQAIVSIAGLGTILLASEEIFHYVKLAGACYLIYIGLSFLLSSSFVVNPGGSGVAKPKPLFKMYLQAVYVTAGNPKAIVFFTAVFPQFINLENSRIPQFCFLVTILAIIAFVCFMIYAFSGQKIVTLFSRTSILKYIKTIIGTSYITAGLHLAFNEKID